MSVRDRLPDRRQNETVTLRHDGHAFTVTIGYDAAGRPREVFANDARSGTAMAHILADACVIISLALQFGVAPGELAKSLGRVPDLDRGAIGGKRPSKPASVLGEIVAVLVEARSEWPGALERAQGEQA